MGGSQPPADAPPPAPVNPYETPAAPLPAAPAPPPPAETPYAAPQYGQPQYGQPQYGGTTPPPAQPAMAGGYPGAGAPGEAKAGKGLAITALVLSFIVCIPYVPAAIAIILAVIVFVRSREGVNRGKGLAITAIIISLLASAAWTVLFVLIGNGTLEDWFEDLLPVENLAAGDCFNAKNLADDDAEFVEEITEVSCSTPHDAEVLVTKTLTADDAESYDPADNSLCSDLISADEEIVAKLQDPNVGTFGLTQGESPNAGDKLVCVAYSVDGTKFDGPL